MSALFSRFYAARVMHQRLGTVRHRLSYRLFCMLVDLDELAVLNRRLSLFSVNRFNLISFRERDHGGQGNMTLRAWVDARLAEAGFGPASRVRLLCMPRVLGAAFNPLSVYFCHGADGGLAALIYEVRNTFGERHLYVTPAGGGMLHMQACDKRFHVSPFQPMELSYRFRVRVPGERLTLAIETRATDAPVLQAVWQGRSIGLTDGALLRCLMAMPLLPFAVLAAIHWQAVLLFLKGARFHRKPGPPPEGLTIGNAMS